MLEEILDSIKQDDAVKDARGNSTWIAVWSRYCGLASTFAASEYDETGGTILSNDFESLTGTSARELARSCLSNDPLDAALGMAALNSLIDVDESQCEERNGRDVLLERSTGRNVVLVGHFPFVPELRAAAGRLSVLELRPRAGDLPAAEAERVIPEAEVVAITGTTFVNHTIEPLLGYCRPEALVILLGPTTPLSPVLFEYGVDIISGARVADPPLVLRQVGNGAGFREMQGVRRLTMQHPGKLESHHRGRPLS
ncbi:MAG TPA: DUF364 domain-containing protein [Dehalococcoidia bacterium]|nr:DUF364 domain-containing protein [Dehalococcoidia bacterium]